MSTEWTPDCSDPNVRAPPLQEYLQRFGSPEARAYYAASNIVWHPPRNDPTIPQNDAQRRSWVLKLGAAMLGIPFTFDTAKFFGTRWHHATKKNRPPYHLRDMWTACEELVGIAERLHNKGRESLSLMCDSRTFIKAAMTKRMTFRKRIQSMIDHLLASKNTVKSLMKGEQRIAFVACAGWIDKKRLNASHQSRAPTCDKCHISSSDQWVLAEQPRKRTADAAQLGESFDRPTKRARRFAPLRDHEREEYPMIAEYYFGVLALLCFGRCLISAYFSLR